MSKELNEIQDKGPGNALGTERRRPRPGQPRNNRRGVWRNDSLLADRRARATLSRDNLFGLLEHLFNNLLDSDVVCVCELRYAVRLAPLRVCLGHVRNLLEASRIKANKTSIDQREVIISCSGICLSL